MTLTLNMLSGKILEDINGDISFDILFISLIPQGKLRGLGDAKDVSLPFKMNLRLLEFGCLTVTTLDLRWLGHLEMFALKNLA